VPVAGTGENVESQRTGAGSLVGLSQISRLRQRADLHSASLLDRGCPMQTLHRSGSPAASDVERFAAFTA
jgi:hypothetical protein